MDSDSELIAKGPCPDCGSSDACASYTDGHTHCFSCGKHRSNPDAPEPKERKVANKELLPQGDVGPLVARRITEDTCRKWGYSKSTFNDRPVQIATYRDERGQPVAQKVRFPDKTFMVRGDIKAAGLYGQWLWRDKGKMVVVTEGEIDALTVSQLQDLKWPVVSVPNGAQGAAKAIARSLEWLMKFETVVFMFDNDEPGNAAALECAELLPPGRAKIAQLPLKDANECLVKGQGDAVIKAMWDAKAFRPDGIVNGADLWEQVSVEDKLFSMTLPWTALQAITRGIRSGELWMFTSGSGMGKSAVVREISHHLLMHGQTVGMIMLEETVKRTALGMMGISANHPLHIDREGVPEAQLKKAFDETLGTGRLYLYDHFGSTAIENLMARIRYLAKGCGCKFIVLDHLSIVVSGNEEGDERRLIDNTMTALKTLAMECDVALIVVSHLKRPSGDRGHEEGAQTSLAQLRGSHAIAQLSDFVIGLERDQQGENPMVTTIRILKNRFTGETGIAGYLAYDRNTGRLSETEEPASSDNPSTGGDANEDF
jgi:twinkle protein